MALDSSGNIYVADRGNSRIQVFGIAIAQPVQYTLTVIASPVAGGSVALNPVQPAGGYAAGTVVTLTATANAGHIFTNWGGDLSGSTNPTTITMSANRNVTANFAATVPATSSLSTGLMIAIFAAVIAVLGIWRTRRLRTQKR